MLVCSFFASEISSVNSQFLKERNFKIIFRNNLERSFLRNFAEEFHLWSTVIGQSACVYKHRMKRHRCWLSIVYLQCESAYFRKKKYFKIEFQN